MPPFLGAFFLHIHAFFTIHLTTSEPRPVELNCPAARRPRYSFRILIFLNHASLE